MTSSVTVAVVFGKRHDNLVRRIQNLDCSKEFNTLNFEEITHTDTRNRNQRSYNMTRDGFTFLVMGFTGKTAAKFKEAYINEFNQMEGALSQE